MEAQLVEPGANTGANKVDNIVPVVEQPKEIDRAAVDAQVDPTPFIVPAGIQQGPFAVSITEKFPTLFGIDAAPLKTLVEEIDGVLSIGFEDADFDADDLPKALRDLTRSYSDAIYSDLG